MGMRETERSLKAYFLVAGGLSTLSALANLGALRELGPLQLPLVWTLVIWTGVITRLVLGPAFLVAGIQLKAALPNGATWIKQMVVIAGAASAAQLALVVLALSDSRDTSPERALISGPAWGAAIGVALAAYLYVNIRRLSAEASLRKSGTAFE